MADSYEKLSVAQLRSIAKAQGVKNLSSMRKPELIEIVRKIIENAPVKGQSETASDQAVEKKVAAPVIAVSEAPADKKEEKLTSVQEKYEDAAAEVQENAAEHHQNRRNNRRNTSDRNRGDRGGRNNRNGSRRDNDHRAQQEQNLSEDKESSAGLNQLDSGLMAEGILDIVEQETPEGEKKTFGFIRSDNYLKGDDDIYVSASQIRKFNLKVGDMVCGNIRMKTGNDKYNALLYVRTVNGEPPENAQRRMDFEKMTPIFPNSRLRLETGKNPVSMRIMDLVSPIGKGQRGMIVSPPKTGKTTLLKQVAKALHTNYPDLNIIILLIDERPEEVTDIKEFIEGDNVEVIYSTFDQLPEHHKKVSEMVIERARRLVEHHKDVVILLDSLTRLARAYNLTCQSSGRTLSGGLDPAALYMPKKFFGAARNMREGGSLTILATALVETGSKMDDVVFEEFKGTGNMELVLDRKLSEKRIFPAIAIPKSSTRREDLLLDHDEMDAMYVMRRSLNGLKADESLERILDMFTRTDANEDFIRMIRHTKFL